MKTKLFSTLLIFIHICVVNLFAQKAINKEKYIIIEVDGLANNFIGYTFCIAKDINGKKAYILNARYKLNKTSRSYVGSDSDFLLTFYIFHKKSSLDFFEIKKPAEILMKKIKNLSTFRDQLLNDKIINDIEIVIKIGKKYYQIANAEIFGQAFSLKEDYHYLPQYSLRPNKFELNLLDKPYTKETMDSLRKVEMEDTSSLKRFNAFLDNDKWYIKNLDKIKKTINFWIRLSSIQPDGYSFGRITNEITYKINFGITDFLINPRRPIFSDEYYKDDYKPVQFTFEKIIDLRNIVLSTPLVKEPKKEKVLADQM